MRRQGDGSSVRKPDNRTVPLSALRFPRGIAVITILPFPDHIPFFMRADGAVVPQIIRNLDDQIPQFQMLCIFFRDAGQSDLCAQDI